MKWLESFVEDTYLLARFHVPQLEGWLRGRIWEKWAARSLGDHTWIHQAAGQLRLFGHGSASGLRHEIDGAGARDGGVILVETKSYSSSSPSKSDICVFDRKTFDLYVDRCRRKEKGPHWRILVSSTALDESIRAYCYLYGIIAVYPSHIPLPMLLALAAKPCAGEFFSDTLLSEIVRLGEPAVASMEKRYVPESHFLKFDLRGFDGRALKDLLWLQSTMSEEFLDLLDRERPGYYEVRAELLVEKLGLSVSAATSTTGEPIAIVRP
ncbi:MAG: hypothetical protein WKF55_00065 [Gemmatimonadaceae bacterium]